MESTIAVIVLFLCISSYEIGAKTTNTDDHTSSNRLDGEISELTANELSIQINNCHEACLQKVCTPIPKKTYSLKTDLRLCSVFVLCFSLNGG